MVIGSKNKNFLFLNDRSTTEIYTLSLHDALPIYPHGHASVVNGYSYVHVSVRVLARIRPREDRKSTRLNSSHPSISYAVFCLKKKMSPPWETTGAQVSPTISLGKWCNQLGHNRLR